jgi:hypothetical protein
MQASDIPTVRTALASSPKGTRGTDPNANGEDFYFVRVNNLAVFFSYTKSTSSYTDPQSGRGYPAEQDHDTYDSFSSIVVSYCSFWLFYNF